ncbi:MAG: site-specific DNA-methyltransferase [Verrucomicrobia bacterium]|nr:site-specific DNA-methyltransferase [Verrucomicrobiota bacterium]
MIDKLDMASMDLVSQNIEKIASLFPNCVTETATGKAIDFDLLKQELKSDIIEGNKERYRLEWPGKREAIVTANIPTTKTLRPVRKDSVDFDNTENLYIEGDNLEVLKLLQESYLGKIKMIYIDPPYNTGNDFVYKDNFAQEGEEYKSESGQKDEHNQRLVANPETSGRYHSNWLTMMYPRLKLARNLLSDDGVIFISIDNHEAYNLKKLCDEIFGERNFIENLIWRKKSGGGQQDDFFATEHEYIICFAKDREAFSLIEKTINKSSTGYNLWDDLKKKKYKQVKLAKWGSAAHKEDRPTMYFPLIDPDGNENYPTAPDGRDGRWRYGKDSIKTMLNEDRIEFVQRDNEWIAYEKEYEPNEDDIKVIKERSIFYDLVENTAGSNELTDLFESKDIFDNPKPTDLIQHLILLSTRHDTGDIVLDFFAGSGSCAHAVFNQNVYDNGNRKFICVQLNEQVSESSKARNLNFEFIPEISKERIKRASKRIKEADNAEIDLGFRVYTLADSNMQNVYYRPQDYKQDALELFADNVKPDRNSDDLLAQVMLDWGLPLTLKIEQLKISGKQVFKVAGNSLMACFDKGVDEDFAKEAATHKPLRIVFRDNSFKNDTAKENVRQLLKQLSPETEMRVI